MVYKSFWDFGYHFQSLLVQHTHCGTTLSSKCILSFPLSCHLAFCLLACFQEGLFVILCREIDIIAFPLNNVADIPVFDYSPTCKAQGHIHAPAQWHHRLYTQHVQSMVAETIPNSPQSNEFDCLCMFMRWNRWYLYYYIYRTVIDNSHHLPFHTTKLGLKSRNTRNRALTHKYHETLVLTFNSYVREFYEGM